MPPRRRARSLHAFTGNFRRHGDTSDLIDHPDYVEHVQEARLREDLIRNVRDDIFREEYVEVGRAHTYTQSVQRAHERVSRDAEHRLEVHDLIHHARRRRVHEQTHPSHDALLPSQLDIGEEEFTIRHSLTSTALVMGPTDVMRTTYRRMHVQHRDIIEAKYPHVTRQSWEYEQFTIDSPTGGALLSTTAHRRT
jgi:hypothetical protein